MLKLARMGQQMRPTPPNLTPMQIGFKNALPTPASAIAKFSSSSGTAETATFAQRLEKIKEQALIGGGQARIDK